jgi:hypothetical protein
VAQTIPPDLIAQRRARLSDFVADAPQALADLARALGIPPIPPDAPGRAAVVVEAGLRRALTEPLDDADRAWLLSRLLYFVGAMVLERHGGAWRVEDEPEGRFHGRYVIGGFPRLPPNAVVDPTAAAQAMLGGEKVEAVLAEIETDLLGVGGKS